jgi:signal transduction histidine kinase
VIDDVLERNRERIGSLGIDVSVDVPGSVAVMCTCDHAAILFGNLIANAIDAMSGTEERRLTISGTMTNVTAVIKIADTGPGISRDEGNRIFNAFYSTKPSTGMGLGLTLCQRIATIYGGALALDTGATRGATFVVTLPASEPGRTIRHDEQTT